MLVATALFAGVFALMPVEDAQAVHTTIQNTQISAVANSVATSCSTDLNANTLVATSNRDFAVNVSMHAGAAAALTGQIADGTNTLVVRILDDNGVNAVLYYPGGTTVTINDSDNTNPLVGCATIVSEGDATASVT